MHTRNYPRLAVDNSGSGSSLPKECLELLKRGDGKTAPRLDPLEKLAVIYNKRRKPRLGHAAIATKLGGVMQKLFFQGHLGLSTMSSLYDAGLIPQMSTGNFPHAFRDGVRDTARTMKNDLAVRIRERLIHTDQSANEASLNAGLDRDYIGDLFKTFGAGDVRNPRTDTIAKLAKSLRCDPHWLATGNGTPGGDRQDSSTQEINSIAQALSPEDKATVLEVMRGLHAKSTSSRAS